MNGSQFTRRSVLAAAGAGAGLALLGRANGAEGSALRSRREISDLEKSFPADLDLLRRAVAEMSKSSAGKSAWERNAEFHAGHCGTPDPALEIHWTVKFLPWHRAFLWMTERNLQHAIGSDKLALPYWHWPVGSAVPKSFRTGALNHPRARTTLEPVDYQFARAMATAKQYVGELDTSGPRPVAVKLGFGGYAGSFFGSALETTPHGTVHNKIGNDMGDLQWSPRDPIFYGHHGNLDRLWEVWRGPDGSPQRTSEPWSDTSFKDAAFEFFDLKTSSTKIVRLSEIAEIAALGYRYAPPGEGPDGGTPAGVSAGAGGAGLVAPSPASLGYPVASGDAALSTGPLGTGSGAAGSTQAILTVQGIAIPAGRGATVAVYLTETGKPFSLERASFAGIVGLVRQPSEVTVSLALDVTDALRATKIAEGRVAVVLLPVNDRRAVPLRVEGYAIRIQPR